MAGMELGRQRDPKAREVSEPERRLCRIIKREDWYICQWFDNGDLG